MGIVLVSPHKITNSGDGFTLWSVHQGVFVRSNSCVRASVEGNNYNSIQFTIWYRGRFKLTPLYLYMASADNPPGAGKLSSLLVQVLTHVLFEPPIPQVIVMEQKYIAPSKIFV
jgi:hypothetical protein